MTDLGVPAPDEAPASAPEAREPARERGHGLPVWVDLSTPDVARAATFYHDLLGWELEHVGGVQIARIDDLEVAGLTERPATSGQAVAAWTVFFAVVDLDLALRTVVASGGAVVDGPADVGSDTRVAVVADPGGAVLGLYHGVTDEVEWASERPGTVTWLELLTRDPATAAPFYEALFGWQPTARPAAGATPLLMFERDGEPVAGAVAPPDAGSADPSAQWAVHFAVDDCHAAQRRAVELGAEVLHPATDVGDGSFAVLADPTGAVFDLLAVRA